MTIEASILKQYSELGVALEIGVMSILLLNRWSQAHFNY